MGCYGGDNHVDMKLLVRPLLPKLNANDPFSTTLVHASQQVSWMQKDGNQAAQQVMSTRWNPTPKQLETLEDIYRRGTRTPNAEQIQNITSQLRKFGKIEGKNVFYWFQNHKARERQKRRRRIEAAERQRSAHYNTNCSSECSGCKHVSGFHVEQIASFCPSTKTPSTVTEQEPISSMRDTIRSSSWDCANEANYPAVLPMLMTDQMNRLEDVQTLELFPLHSDHKAAEHRSKPSSSSSSSTLIENCTGGTVLSSNMSPPFQFFHFLPLKN